jgi:hypothetical protein
MPGKISLLVCILLVASSTAAQRKTEGGTRLLFTGDILLTRQVAVELNRRRVSPWTSLAELFRSATWVGGNLEGTLGSASGCEAASQPCFATPESAVALLKNAGFSAVTVENNHAGDLGGPGREQTEARFRDAGLLALDFSNSPQFLRFGDVTVALIAITMVRAADGRVQEIPSVEVAQKLRLAQRLANLVAVSIHWGNELQDWPSDAQKTQARWLVDHGASLILGHHPHVVQNAECVAGKPVFYSLGNHVFDQKYPETKKGLIADCRLSAGLLSCTGIATDTPAATSFPTLRGSDRDVSTALQACTPKLNENLVVDGTRIRPEAWSARQPPDGLILQGWRRGQLVWRTRRQRVLSLQLARLAGSDERPLFFSLERHPSPIDNEDGVRPYVYDVGPHGLIAKWRGSALAWPLLDAVVDEFGELCALHRGDSFAVLDPNTKERRIEAYRWKGFGFYGVSDPDSAHRCQAVLK